VLDVLGSALGLYNSFTSAERSFNAAKSDIEKKPERTPEDEQELQRLKQELDSASSILPLLGEIMRRLYATITDSRFKRETAKAFQNEFNRITLFKTLCKNEMGIFENASPEDITRLFAEKFPSDIVQDPAVMRALLDLGKRIDCIDVKYAHVSKEILAALDVLLKCTPPESFQSSQNRLEFRRAQMRSHVRSQPQSQAILSHLLSLGYSEALWDSEDVMLKVTIEDAQNIEDNYMKELLALYAQYKDILIGLGYETLEIDKKPVKMSHLFRTEEYTGALSIEELRGRRNVATREIQKATAKSSRRVYISSRLLSLLQKERDIEEQFEKLRKTRGNTVTQKTYFIRLVMDPLETLGCCSAAIAGCYAPDGDHCEKALENSLKPNAAFISVFECVKDELGDEVPSEKEIENAEVLFTDQGLFVYKIYSNAHQFDTSAVWATMLKKLVELHYVPQIILPEQFPNAQTYRFISETVPTELSGSVITFKDDWFEDPQRPFVESYYDFKPLKIKVDFIVLNSENAADINEASTEEPSGDFALRLDGSHSRVGSSSGLKTVERREPVKKPIDERDFSGHMMQFILQKCRAAEIAEPMVNVFARPIALCLNDALEHGIVRNEFIEKGFNLEQWNRKLRKQKKPELSVEERNRITAEIREFLAGFSC
jgi:hypothetical protein